MLHVELDRVVREAEALGDLRVGESPGDEAPDLALPRRQVSRGTGAPAFDPATRRLREDQPAPVDLPDCGERLLRGFGFEGEPVRAGVER